MAKSVKPKKKNAARVSPLREIVGDDVYGVWVKMLKELVPDGRTHRLSVVVASMLAYASSVASSNRDPGDARQDSRWVMVRCRGMTRFRRAALGRR